MKSIVSALLLAAPVIAQAAPTYTLYAGKNLELESGTKVTGAVAAGGNVNLKSKTEVTGNVTSKGIVNVESESAVKGNVYAAAKVNLKSKATVTGSVDSAAAPKVSVTIEDGAKIGGKVTHNAGAKVTVNGSGKHGGEVVKTVTAPTLAAMPGATTFAISNKNQLVKSSKTDALAHGVYGNLNLEYDSTLKLSGGDYYFDSLTVGSSGKFIFDLSGGPIHLYFKSSVNIGDKFEFETLNGSASDIYAETLGNWTMGSNSAWYGTLLGSGANSNLHFNSDSTLGGFFMARNNLELGANTIVGGIPAQPNKGGANELPVPGSLPLLGLGLAALALYRRKAA